MDTDSDSDSCQDLKLRLPTGHDTSPEVEEIEIQPVARNESKKVKYEFDFSPGPFVKKQTSSSFGDGKDQPPTKFLESNILFNSLSCAENRNEADICILRLNDLLANIDSSLETMSKELIKYGKILDSKNFEQLHQLGFTDKNNKHILNQNILSIQASLRLLHTDSEDLQTLLATDPPQISLPYSTSKTGVFISAGLLVFVGGLVFAWKKNHIS